jgi:pilus assembly protein TadC
VGGYSLGVLNPQDFSLFVGMMLFILVVVWLRRLLLALYRSSGMMARMDGDDDGGVILGRPQSFLQRIITDLRGRADKSIDRFFTRRDTAHLELLFIQAGYPNLHPRRYYTIRLVAAVSTALALVLLRATTGFPGGTPGAQLLFLLLGVLATTTAYIVPRLVLLRKRFQRQKKALSEAHMWMSSLAVLLKSGKSTQEAISILSQYPGVLYSQGAQIQRDMQLGRSFVEGLVSMAERVGVPEFTEVAKQITRFNQKGLPLHDNLRIQANILFEETQARIQTRIGRNILMIFALMVIFALPVFCTVLIAPVGFDVMQRFAR